MHHRTHDGIYWWERMCLLLTIYTVRRGDALWQLSRRFGVSADAITAANQLQNPSVLSVGQALVIPGVGQSEPVRRSVIVNGYVTDTAAETLSETLPYLTFLSPFSYRTDENGVLTPTFSVPPANGADGAADLLTITNLKASGGFSSAAAHAILTQEEPQNAFLRNVAALLRSGRWYGVNLDFEYVYPFDRGSYNQFLRRFAEMLHSLGALLITALAPKQSGSQAGLLYSAHDYAAHGEIADYVVLMTYEWGYTYGPPMAVAPVNEVRKVLDYAVSVMPAGKILLGVPNYGYNWTLPFRQGTAAKPLTNTAAVTLAGTVGAEIRFSESAQSPYFNYTDSEGRRHEVWFEDARSLRAKYRLVADYGLAGVSYWNLNRLFRTNFLVLENMFGIEKVL